MININKYEISLSYNELDIFHVYIYVYIIIFVEMNNDFKKRILKNYLINPFWKKVIEILYRKAFYDDVNVVKFSFVLRELESLLIDSIIII